jgi:hypothetical protein
MMASKDDIMLDSIDWIMLARITLIGVVGLSLWELIDLVWYRWFGLLTTGRVVDIIIFKGGSPGFRGPKYAPVFEYHADGITWRVQSRIATKAYYELGQEVPVYYFVDTPGDGRVFNAHEIWKWIMVGGSCGLVLAVLMRS